jgi:hypothetical protein
MACRRLIHHQCLLSQRPDGWRTLEIATFGDRLAPMSRPNGPGQPAFLHGCCGELQRGEDISPVQVREVNKDLGDGQPRGELAQYRAHRHPGVPDAGQAAHPVRVDGNPLVRHAPSVRRPNPSRRGHRICPAYPQPPGDQLPGRRLAPGRITPIPRAGPCAGCKLTSSADLPVLY